MLVIRLQRVGRKNDPSFRIIVNEKERSAKAGNIVELLGSYNPKTKNLSLKEDRAKYWLSVGAKPSATAHNILVSKGVLNALKIDVSAKSKKVEVPQKTEEPAPAAQ